MSVRCYLKKTDQEPTRHAERSGFVTSDGVSCCLDELSARYYVDIVDEAVILDMVLDPKISIATEHFVWARTYTVPSPTENILLGAHKHQKINESLPYLETLVSGEHANYPNGDPCYQYHFFAKANTLLALSIYMAGIVDTVAEEIKTTWLTAKHATS